MIQISWYAAFTWFCFGAIFAVVGQIATEKFLSVKEKKLVKPVDGQGQKQ